MPLVGRRYQKSPLNEGGQDLLVTAATITTPPDQFLSPSIWQCRLPRILIVLPPSPPARSAGVVIRVRSTVPLIDTSRATAVPPAAAFQPVSLRAARWLNLKFRRRVPKGWPGLQNGRQPKPNGGHVPTFLITPPASQPSRLVSARGSDLIAVMGMEGCDTHPPPLLVLNAGVFPTGRTSIVELKLTLDRRNLAKFRTLLKASRTEAAKALTFTAEKVEPAWRAGQSVFHQRNTWLSKGVRKKAATPGKLVAQVYHKDEYLGRHVPQLARTKQREGGGRLLVPTYGGISEALTHTRMRAKLRQADRTKRKTFVVMDSLLVRRKGKARTPLIVLGKLMKQNQTEPRFDVLNIVDGVVRREFPKVYERLLVRWAETGKR